MNHRDTENTEEHRVAAPTPADTLCVPAGENSSRTDRKRSDSVRIPSGPRAVAHGCQAGSALGKPIRSLCPEEAQW